MKTSKLIAKFRKFKTNLNGQKIRVTTKWMKNIFNPDFDTTWGTFCSSCNIGSLAEIHSSRTKLRKAFWISMFLLMTALSTWRCSSSFQSYFSFDTIASTTIETVDEIGIILFLNQKL